MGDEGPSSDSQCATPCEVIGPGFRGTVKLLGDGSTKVLGKETGGAERF